MNGPEYNPTDHNLFIWRHPQAVRSRRRKFRLQMPVSEKISGKGDLVNVAKFMYCEIHDIIYNKATITINVTCLI